MKYLDKNTEVKLSIKDAIGVGFVLVSIITLYFTLKVEIAEAKQLPPPIITAEEFKYKDEIITKTIKNDSRRRIETRVSGNYR